MSRPKILYDLRMVHRNVFRAVFEIAHWVASCTHHAANESIGALYRLCRVVHEVTLYDLPLVNKTPLILLNNPWMCIFSTRPPLSLVRLPPTSAGWKFRRPLTRHSATISAWTSNTIWAASTIPKPTT